MAAPLIVVHHEGCATAEALLLALRERGEAAEDLLQEGLAESHPWKRLASPAVFEQGTLVLGDPTPREGPACAAVDWRAWLESRQKP